MPLTAFASLSPAFSNPGFTFVGWNTASNGSGTSYADGQTYGFTSDLVLYAQWQGSYHVVTFYENDSPSDNVYATQTSNSPESLTRFSSLTPSFTNPGYSFSGWNTASNGSGTSYSDGSPYSFTSDLGLYAQWTANASLAVNFVDNGGTGTVAPLSAPTGTSVVLPGGSGLSDPGYAFTGWNTQANGSGTAFSVGSTITLSSNLTLYAQWTTSKFVVTFDADGGTASIPSEQFAAGSTPFALPNATLAGSTFEGWFTAPSGGSLVGAAGASYAPIDSVTLYAQWSTPTPSTSSAPLVLTFAPNGGSGSLAPATVADGAPTNLPGGVFIRPGYVFEGWSTSSKGSGTVYAPGQSFTPTTSETLYAVWRRAPAAETLYGAVGDFPHFTTALTPALSRQVMTLARVIRVKGWRKVELLGYTASTGLGSVDRALSVRRADVVARALRADLRRLHVRGVTIRASGEGSIDRRTAPVYSRVEVFLA